VSAAVGGGTEAAIQAGQLLRAGVQAGAGADVTIKAETSLRVDDFLANYVNQATFAEGLADVFIPYYGDTWWENLLRGVASFVPILPLEQLLDITMTDTPLGILAHSCARGGNVDVSVHAGFDVNAGGWFGLGGAAPVAPGVNVSGQIFVGVSLSAGIGVELWSQSFSNWEPVEPQVVLPDPLRYECSAIPSTNINVTFNKDLDMSSVTNSSVRVSGSRSGTHTALFSFDSASNVLTIDPVSDFLWDETVSIVLDRSIRDLAGRQMAGDVGFSFYIPEEPLASPTSISPTVSLSSATVDLGESLTVSGHAWYDTGQAVRTGTVVISLAGQEWTASIRDDGSYSRDVTAPDSAGDYTVSIHIADGLGRTGITSTTVSVRNQLPVGCNLSYVTTCGDYWIEDLGGGDTEIHPQDERNRFSPTEAGGLWAVLRVEDITQRLQARVLTLRPDGTEAWSHTWSGYTEPYWDYAYWPYGWDDVPSLNEPGNWRFVWYLRPEGGSFEEVATSVFTYRYDFTEHKMAESVQEHPPGDPVGPTNSFDQNDARAYTWMNLDNLSEDISVKWDWFEPNGSMHMTYTADPISTVDVTGDFDPPYDSYRVWGWMGISGEPSAQKCGDWRVEVAVRDPWDNWDVQYTDRFVIYEAPAVPPTVSVTPSVSDPIETQAFSWSVSASDNTYLDAVTLYWHDGSLHSQEWTDLYSSSKSESVPVGPYGAGQQVQYWAVAKDTSGNTYESPRKTLVVQPETVSAPYPPSGPAACEPNQAVTFSTGGSTTSLGGGVEYQFDWGDEQVSSWGLASQSHTWTNAASYPVRARARSQASPTRISDWSEVGLVTVALNGPSGLDAVAVSSSEIDLSWTDNSAQEDGFRIERRVVGGIWAEIDTVAADVSTYRDYGLADQTEYLYRVRAFSAAGNSLFSNEASATTGAADDEAPTADLAHPVDGGSIPLATINVHERYIDVRFTDTGGSGLDLSTITDSGAEFTLSGAAASGVTVNGAPTLVNGTTYRYSFTGDFGGGSVGVDFTAGAWADNAGNTNDAETEGFTVMPILGDTNGDGAVDGADYTTWADHYKDTPVPAWADGGWQVGNFNSDDVVDGGDYTLWADNYTGSGGGAEVLAAAAYDAAGDAPAGASDSEADWPALLGNRTASRPASSGSRALGTGLAAGREQSLPAWPLDLRTPVAAEGRTAWPGEQPHRVRPASTLSTRALSRLLTLDDEVDLLGGPDLSVLGAAI